ncbi:MAG TPA: flagellar basal-body rod protein FlgF [Stellaceae bacterium]|nr:flagellar basal-body rod protein FlgF [Stellaceae bacterium]
MLARAVHRRAARRQDGKLVIAMDTSSAIALSSQFLLQRQTDAIANNLANLSTTAFKAQHRTFAEYLIHNPDGSTSSSVQETGTARDMAQGPISQTGNPLDIAINGEGFLAVGTPFGPRYTRSGHFQIDATGQLVTSQGSPVLNTTGNPITVPEGTSDITVSQDGTITTKEGQAGKLQVVSFADNNVLHATANGLYTTTQAAQPVNAPHIVQGALEGSNVQAVIELTRLMSVERGNSYAKDFIDGEANRIQTALDHLGKVP